MVSSHTSRHTIEVLEKAALTGIAAAVVLLGAVSLATLIYTWFIA